ncbi:hypothetical protein QZH41_018633 [Actinostola sp. cb2023]|nr:hypothetical protein QZH41_018633 [Actinostola sp. cb2023]
MCRYVVSVHRCVGTSMHRYVSTSVYRYVHVSVCQCVHASVCRYVVSVHRCVGTSMHRYVSTSVYRYVHVSVCRCVHASVCRYVHVSVCRCVHASVCWYVHASHGSTHEDTNQRVGSWVQCGRPDCGKWRCLNVTVDSHDLADKWMCTMNTDCNYNTCEASQEAFDSQDEDFDVVYTSFPEGSIVWAKVAGYPWWPGMMESDPDYGYYCETEENSRVPVSGYMH